MINIGFIAVLTAMNLRGVRESGRAFAVPTYAFIAGVMAMIGIGLVRALLGDAPQAESAHYGIHAEQAGLNTLAISLLALRAFSSGCTALTGVEAISNGVPAFRKPKALNAARTMSWMGALAITMFAGVTALALISHTRVVENTCDLIGFPGDCNRDAQRTVIAQIAAAVFGNDSVMFYYLQAVTALILILAANTAYNGFPLLSSILAQDRYLPRQLHTRGNQSRIQWHHPARGDRRWADLCVWRVDDPADPALHLGCVHLLHAVPNRHGVALEPGIAQRR